MRIIVCGGRDYADEGHVREVLDDVVQSHPDLTIVHGGARGADLLAQRVATELAIPVEIHLAEWDVLDVDERHIKTRPDGSRYNVLAGFERNQRMLDSGIDAVYAFPGGNGTDDMCRRAMRAGVPVYRV